MNDYISGYKDFSFLVGKTIKNIAYDNFGSEDKIIIYFTDNTSSVIKTTASNQMYYMYIENRE